MTTEIAGYLINGEYICVTCTDCEYRGFEEMKKHFPGEYTIVTVEEQAVKNYYCIEHGDCDTEE